MKKIIWLVSFGLFICWQQVIALPPGFVYLNHIAPTIQQDIRYHSQHNFIGRPIKGYEKATCILSKKAAFALLHIQKKLNQQDLGLKVFDCYRPQMAVNEFVAWSQNLQDQRMKQLYYPNIAKDTLFRKHYLSNRSGHSRGSTVDLTLIKLSDGTSLDMGTPYDFLDKRSHPSSKAITKEQWHNRQLLKKIMTQYGFRSLKTEWWHFTLRQEPYPKTYFNFKVK